MPDARPLLTAPMPAAKTSRMKPAVGTLLCILAAIGPATGAGTDVPLNPGDPAPPIKVGAWLQGDAVKEFAKGQTYVVDFWNTEALPCRETIPLLTGLAKKFGGKAVFLGVSVFEDSPNDVARLQKVSEFAKEMGAKMSYAVAADSSGGTMGETWMNAAAQTDVPSTFIVNAEGAIAWIGRPKDVEQVLGQVLAGTFDTKAFAGKRERERREADDAQENIAPIALLARQGRNAEALKAIEELIAKDAGYEEKTMGLHFQLLIATDEKAAYAYARKLAADQLKTEPQALAQMAQTVSAEARKAPDMDLAEELAVQADNATEHKSPGALAVLADIRFRKGDFAKALAAQEAAIALLEKMTNVPGRAVKEMKATLEKMRAAAAGAEGK